MSTQNSKYCLHFHTVREAKRLTLRERMEVNPMPARELAANEKLNAFTDILYTHFKELWLQQKLHEGALAMNLTWAHGWENCGRAVGARLMELLKIEKDGPALQSAAALVAGAEEILGMHTEIAEVTESSVLLRTSRCPFWELIHEHDIRYEFPCQAIFCGAFANGLIDNIDTSLIIDMRSTARRDTEAKLKEQKKETFCEKVIVRE